MTERILCVDDEPKVLSAFQRQLYGQFELATATSGVEALELIASKGPFAVIVSDMRMPGMDGVQFLVAAKRCAPDSVRIMLTGNADQQTAVEAINAGNIFRFLTKPCDSEALSRALLAGVAQYRLVTAERELLEKTLRGAIRLLAEVLSLTSPVAFGHGSRAQRLVSKLCKQMQVERPWQIEVAAMLSQIGCVTIPPETLEKAYRGEALPPQELQMLEAHPGIAGNLIRNIPRLEDVARIVAYQMKCFDGSGIPPDDVRGVDIPLGSRILKVATDYDTLKRGGCSAEAAGAELRTRAGRYDPAVLAALDAATVTDQAYDICDFALNEVKPHAVLAEDVISPSGCVLIHKGQEITPSVRGLLYNFARRQGIEKQIRVRVYMEKQPGPTPPTA